MATKIVTKNSSTASAVPTTSDLVQGELAVNVADKRLFTEDNTGTIVELGTNPSTIDIDAGTIDGAVIGDNTPAAITGSTVTSTGNIVVSGTVDGRDVAADGTKLDGIEASADVTDTTNVTAAGALMDSEVTNLAQVKAFDSSDYATAAQGTTADNALPKSGGAMTGAITTNSTFDGRDVATDGTKLDGIEAGANVTDTANVTAAGALMDSEVTNLAQVKAFDSSDYATAAQGTTADNALPKSGGALTGPVTTTSTFDGRDVATDGTKLDGIEASADVTDTANVTAAGAVMDSELTSEASVKALNQGVATTDSPSFVNLTLSGTGSVKVPSGTTAQRDGSPANGMFRYNSTNEQFEGYQSGAWGAIGGGGGSNTFTADTFTGDGSTTAYALSQVVNSEDNLLVFIAGVFQQQSAYSIATASGTTTLTFATAPANTREIIVYSVASAVSGTNLNIDSMTGDGSDTTLSLTINPVNENNTQVFIDGVYQNKDTYSISGTTLTFSTAPPNGSAVEVMTMTQTEINVPVDGTITPAKIASGDFYFDTNTLYVDSTNNRVGIGTSSPASLLHLENSAGGSGGYTKFTDVTYGGDVRFGMADGVDNNAISGVWSNNDYLIYTNSTERLRIDSSGNLLVGTTDSTLYNQSTNSGFAYQTGQALTIARSGGDPLALNRLSTDGSMLLLQKDGSTVGSIATEGGDLAIGNGDAGIQFVNGNEHFRPFNVTTNAATDNLMDIGSSSKRFKDLYLSGGAYLGGTGAANKLDDYEEGTWTPDVGGGNVTWLSNQGVYTKVGRLVTVTFWLQAGSTDSSSGTVSIIGLPFATNSVGRSTAAIRAYNLQNVPSGTDGFVGWTGGSSTSVSIVSTSGGLASGTALNRNVWKSGAEIHFSLTYMTA